jgi:hypothetical protein
MSDQLTHLEQLHESNVATQSQLALRALQDARLELDMVEAQLRLALQGEPYLRVGRLNGVDAGVVFTAFAAVESLAHVRQAKEREVEGSSLRRRLELLVPDMQRMSDEDFDMQAGHLAEQGDEAGFAPDVVEAAREYVNAR